MVAVLKLSCESGICGYVSLSEAFIVSCKTSMVLAAVKKNGEFDALLCIGFDGLAGGSGGCIIDVGLLGCGGLLNGWTRGWTRGWFLKVGFQNVGFLGCAW